MRRRAGLAIALWTGGLAISLTRAGYAQPDPAPEPPAPVPAPEAPTPTAPEQPTQATAPKADEPGDAPEPDGPPNPDPAEIKPDSDAPPTVDPPPEPEPQVAPVDTMPAKLADVAIEPEPPPRPPPPEIERGPELPWLRRLEIGGDLAIVARPAGKDISGNDTGITYAAAVGFGLHARFEIVRWLRFSAYFVDSHHDVTFSDNALGLSGTVATDAVSTYSLGARLAPTWPWAEWGRSWVSVGIGWGRLEFERMQVQPPDQPAYEVRERSTPFVEVPFGIGTSVDIIDRWLALELEFSAAPVIDQAGNALEDFQAIDGQGTRRNVGPFPTTAGHFVQTVGLSLLL